MSRLQIYGVAFSRAIGPIWAALELGLDYDNVPIGWDDGSIYGEAYRRINPNARVPAIRDGDFVLWESLAITTYLAKKRGGPLAPRTLEEDALTMQWTLWAQIHLAQTLHRWALHTYIREPEDRDPALAAKAVEDLQPLLGVLDGQVSKAPYLLGDRFTVADLNVGCVLLRPRMQLDYWRGRPRLEAWDKRVFERPAAKRAYEIRAAA